MLARALVEELGSLRVGQARRIPERAGELGRGLSMGTGGGGHARGLRSRGAGRPRRRPPHRRGGPAARARAPHRPAASSAARTRACSAPRCPGSVASRMACRASSCRKAYRRPSAWSRPPSMTLLRRGRGHDPRQEIRLDRRADHGRGLQRGTTSRREPRCTCEDGIADRRRDARRSSGDHLGHVERVATGPVVELLGHRARCLRPAPGPRRGSMAGCGRRRTAGDVARSPTTTRSGCCRPTSSSRYVADHQRARRFDPPSDKPERVECRLVGPVEVIDEEDQVAATRAQRPQQPLEDVVARGAPRRGAGRIAGSRSSATSTSGPSGRGVESGSQEPRSTRVRAPSDAPKARSSDVLPTPASPSMNTRRPSVAASARRRSRVASGASRSSRRIRAS